MRSLAMAVVGSMDGSDDGTHRSIFFDKDEQKQTGSDKQDKPAQDTGKKEPNPAKAPWPVKHTTQRTNRGSAGQTLV